MTKFKVGDILIPRQGSIVDVEGIKSRVITNITTQVIFFREISFDDTVKIGGWDINRIQDFFLILDPKIVEFKKQLDGL